MEITKLILKALDKYRYQLIEDYIYIVYNKKKKVINFKVNVPKGFVTDLTSSPKFMWILFPPCGEYTKASIIHDYLYSKECNICCKRKMADLIFLCVMEDLKVGFFKRHLMFYAVRFFGFNFFRK